ncbi:MAG: pantoate--beta-alanine ligase [Bacteroidales bacterium]|nr:pantoate--beta-alanine ligase [Bacteroidales bacterium]MBR6265759.1 pantoate--beta-alanine ligase [Bacteroidales bacterium]
MIICKTRDEISAAIAELRRQNKTLGFVPTMGALHNGHLSLVKKSMSENDCTAVSIFVNPTQFNNKHDLQTYPRTVDADVKLLEETGADIAFVPSVETMYPEGLDNVTESYDFGFIGQVMEGAARPGHFNGVGIVVHRLFDLVKPDRAYFGMKDFQQIAIIREMVRQCNINIEIIPCPIVREDDGLALSSRNTRLNEEQRRQAVQISQTLFKAVGLVGEKSVDEVKEFVISTVNSVPLLDVEYFEIVDGYSLQTISSWNEAEWVVGCITVNVGDVRLIDNITLKK